MIYKLNDVNNFHNSINNTKEKNTYFKEKIEKSRMKYKKYKLITTILKSFDTFIKSATTTNSIMLPLTKIALIVKPISTGIACELTIGNKVKYEIVMQRYNKNKEEG